MMFRLVIYKIIKINKIMNSYFNSNNINKNKVNIFISIKKYFFFKTNNFFFFILDSNNNQI